MEKLLLTNALIVTLGENNRIIEDGCILIEDKLISDIGPKTELAAKYPGVKTLDMKGMLVMPGLINAHHHLYSTFARGMSLKDAPPENFVQILERLWWRLDKNLIKEDLYYSALFPLIDCIKHGTTTVIDHHASQGFVPGSLDELENAARLLGIRSSFCYEVSDRLGEKVTQEGIDENIRFLQKCHSSGDDLIAAAFGLHASFTVSANTLKACKTAAEVYKAPFHVHCAEDKADVEDCQNKYGMSILERFNSFGMLEHPFLAIHGVHFNAKDEALASQKGVFIVHNPESNMNNAVGYPRILDFLKSGIKVALGTDGFTSDFFKEICVMPLMHKFKYGDPRTFSFDDLYNIVFLNNPKVAKVFFPKELGVLKTGSYADIIALEYNPPTPLNSGNFLGHLLFGIASARVNTSIINGKPVMLEGKILGLDEPDVAAKAREISAKFWKRFLSD
jgi:putative selenium metabolism protein SsnA